MLLGPFLDLHKDMASPVWRVRPDLNPIQLLWDLLESHMRAKHHHATSVLDLNNALLGILVNRSISLQPGSTICWKTRNKSVDVVTTVNLMNRAAQLWKGKHIQISIGKHKNSYSKTGLKKYTSTVVCSTGQLYPTQHIIKNACNNMNFLALKVRQ